VAILRPVDEARRGLFAEVALPSLYLRRHLPSSLDALVVRHLNVHVDAVVRPRLVLRAVNPRHIEIHDRVHDRCAACARPIVVAFHYAIVPLAVSERVGAVT